MISGLTSLFVRILLVANFMSFKSTVSKGYAVIIVTNFSKSTAGLTRVFLVYDFNLFTSLCNCWNLPVVMARLAL